MATRKREPLVRLLGWLERLASRPLGALVLFGARARRLRGPCDRLAAEDRPRPRRVPLRVHPALRPRRPAAVVDALPHAGHAASSPELRSTSSAARLAEPLMAVLFAGSIVGWTAAARYFGPRVALAVAAALLVYPGYALMFHELSSEPVVRGRLRAAGRCSSSVRPFAPSVGRFALVGLGVAVLALVRPGNAVLLAFGVVPARSSPGRGVSGSAGPGRSSLAAVAPTRRVVRAQRRSLRHVGARARRQRDHPLLPRVHHRPHRLARERRGVTAARRGDAAAPADPRAVPLVRRHARRALRAGSFRVHEDLYLLSDQVFGWDSDYGVLRERRRRGRASTSRDVCARASLETVWDELAKAQFRVASVERGRRAAPSEPATVVIRGSGFPRRPRASRSRPDRSSGSRVRTRASARSGRRRRSGTSSSTTRRDASALRARSSARTDDLFDALPNRAGQRAARAPPQPALALVPAAVDVDRRRPRRASPSGDRAGWPTLVALVARSARASCS